MNKRIIANELLPVYETDRGEKVVDGRELHDFLQVGRDFTNWMKDRIEKYGFIQGEDFSPILAKTPDGGRPRTEYILKLDIAKELAMVENNEQGSKARKYFIDVEKRFKQQSVDISKLDPQMQMFHHMFQSVARTQLQLAETQKQLSDVQDTITTIQETFLQRDEEWRESINTMIRGAAFRFGGNYRELWNKSYEILESRARCDLDARLRNHIKRLEDVGAPKSQIQAANRIDVIEADPRLKEIYSTVVKELSISSLRVAK